MYMFTYFLLPWPSAGNDTCYSETTSTGTIRGLSANQKPILKQRNERADLRGNCLIFRLVSFDPKFSTFEMAYSQRQPIRDRRILAFHVINFTTDRRL